MPSDTNTHTDRTVPDAIGRWVDFCQRRAGMVVLGAVLISVLAAVYLAQNIRIDTNTEDMLSASLPFRQNAIALDREFPILESNLLVVLEAPNSDAADAGAKRLVDAMRLKPEIFGSVFSSQTDPFLLKNGFLYLDTAKLEDIAARLAAAQPFLGTLWRAPNLDGLADMLALLERSEGLDGHTLAEANSVLERMAAVTESVRKGQSEKLVWSEVLLGEEPEKTPVRRLIFAKPNLDYASLHPAARAQDAVYDIARELYLNSDGFAIRLTGSAALESDELKSVEVGMGLAGLISLALVILILWVGLRSVGVMIALLATLLFGLLWTAAFAILALGSLNLISVAFAVLFVGLSVDFGIHYALRVSEHTPSPEAWRGALVEGGRGVGPSLVICALTTAIAFFSFAPTAYIGLAELGLIAGVGMFVALLANLTVLPAMLRLFVRKPPVFRQVATEQGAEHTFFRKWARVIVAAGIVSACVAGWVARDTHFDFDPMNLKDP
ncbi:MAG: MMPL family transporter, partial [Rhodospirillales bacterium]